MLSLLLIMAATHAAADCTVYSLVKDGTCAQACLNKTVGICPVSLVVKAGHLQAKACKDEGFNRPNGTKTQKAGPCGNITFDLYTKGSSRYVSASGRSIILATFEESSPLTWTVVDDPVMGGQSRSHLSTDAANRAARWYGQVKIVPFLKSPGFCTFRTREFKFPDVSGTSGIHMRIRNNFTGGLSRFVFQLRTKDGRSGVKQGTYSGNVTVPVSSAGQEWIDVSTNWNDFDLTWRGQKIYGPKLSDQLDQIQSIGLSTFFPGTVGKFDLEVQTMTAQ